MTSMGDGHATLFRTDGCELVQSEDDDGRPVLEVLLPCGTRLRDATFGDCVEAAGWYMVEARKARAAGNDGKADALEANAKIVTDCQMFLFERTLSLFEDVPDGHLSH